MKVQIHTRLKEGVLDPQGKAVESALKNLGYKEINKIRQGKLFDIDVDTTDPVKAKEIAENICKSLLANLVIEDFSIEVIKEI
ncbi:MAG: phosphoribosylformylglycinamidine synthase [Rickettsiales bacterium]|nr:phosphoribosylformylglycinamidine synthase [Rickettsiales bacterium]|tara:strand:+ start:205 stop:453 length:249 start_codon:yes stop_codon:yes gene_type:complete